MSTAATIQQHFEGGIAFSENIPGHGTISFGLCRTPNLEGYYANVQVGLDAPVKLEGSDGDLTAVVAACEARLILERAKAKPPAITNANAKTEREKKIAGRGGVRWSPADLERKARGTEKEGDKDGADAGETAKLRASMAELSADLAEVRARVNDALNEITRRMDTVEGHPALSVPAIQSSKGSKKS